MIWKHRFLHREATRKGTGRPEMTSVREGSCAKPLFIERGFFI
jgi:hypothetical protein